MTTARNISRTLLLCLSAGSMALVLGCSSGGGGSWGDGAGGGWGGGGDSAAGIERRRSTGPVEADAESIGLVFTVGGLFDGDQPDPCKVAAHKLKQAEIEQKRAERAFRSTVSKLRQLSSYANKDAARRSSFKVLTANRSSDKARRAALRAAADEVRDTRTKEAIRYHLRCKAIIDAQAAIAEAWQEIETAADLLDDCGKKRKRS